MRVSERVWGYAVTYRDAARCKHYLVEAARAYRLLPTGQVAHDTLGTLKELGRNLKKSFF